MSTDETVAPSRVSNRQAERTARTRHALIEAAIDQINAVGAGAVTTKKIAEAADLTRGAVQHNFAAPVDLYLAVVEYAWADIVTLHDKVPGSGTSLDERIAGWAALMIEAYDRPAARAAFELLVVHRSDEHFLTAHLTRLREAEVALDALWCDGFIDSGLTTAELVRVRGIARTFVLGSVFRRVTNPDVATGSELKILLGSLIGRRRASTG